MKLVNVDRQTEATFLRCLHDEEPDDPRVIGMRRSAYEEALRRGLRAKVLILDSGEVAGLCQCMPIEETHLLGHGLMAVLCIWVHGYEHHIGNRQGNGYGRYILDSIEDEARGDGFAGVAAWGMDFPYWNPVSFYEHMGYERADKVGEAVLVWKSFEESAEPPRFRRARRRPPVRPDRVSVAVFNSGWCTSMCSQCVTAREAIEGLDEIVDYLEVGTADRRVLDEWGIWDLLLVEGELHRPNEPPCTSDVLRDDIVNLARDKGLAVPD